ncbi:MAG: alpha/beta hydrolase [Candidatus Nitrosocosmicus sp.]|nr:alpha/beta hydrolase [Candidatus Nitrosocosmicus sp.]
MSNESQTREIIDSFPIRKTTVDDIEIEYKILKRKNMNGSDDNTPLLFIPGLRITMDMWPPIMLNELTQSISSVIIYNNRGTGNSSTGSKDYSIKQLAKDAADLLKSLGIEKAHVIGWSMGAYIATELALLYPDKVSSLILYGSGPGGDKAIPSSAELMQTLGGVSGTPEEQARQILSFFFPSTWLLDNPDFIDKFPLLKSTVSIETTQKQAQAIVGWDGIYNTPSLITQPTLVLIGTEDIITTPKAAFSLIEKIPLISLIQIKDAGHGLMYQYPEKFTKMLQTFLDII